MENFTGKKIIDGVIVLKLLVQHTALLVILCFDNLINSNYRNSSAATFQRTIFIGDVSENVYRVWYFS